MLTIDRIKVELVINESNILDCKDTATLLDLMLQRSNLKDMLIELLTQDKAA